LLFAELLAEAGLPPGAFNVVPGPGASVGAAMAEHPGIDKISFTGETETGKSILRAAAGTVKRVSMELGGKSPNVVFADADLDAAAKGAINAIFYGKGELCSAGSRLLVEDSVHDALMQKALRTAKQLKAGTVWVNTYNFYDPGLPFGGYKESGFGRERGRYALEEYTQVKSVWIDLT